MSGSQSQEDTRLPSLRSFRPPEYRFWIGAAMAMQEYLPGRPTKRLVRLVRAHLRSFGICPRGKPWRAAWSWAYAIANSYLSPQWPTSYEISTQYVLLLLVEMKSNLSLRLPYRAGTVVPPDVRAMLPNNSIPMLIHEPVSPGDKAQTGDAD